MDVKHFRILVTARETIIASDDSERVYQFPYTMTFEPIERCVTMDVDLDRRVSSSSSSDSLSDGSTISSMVYQSWLVGHDFLFVIKRSNFN